MTGPTNSPSQIFVAYSYSLYPKDDYRKIFAELESKYAATFIFADEKITNMHIMSKIVSYIKGAAFSIFDISGWNPNVTLELGFAMATNDNWYISYNPKHTPHNEVPSDIRGIDRIQYGDLSEYAGKLLALMDQRLTAKQVRPPITDYIETLQEELLVVLEANPGLKVSEIAEVLKVDIRLAKVVVNPLIGGRLTTTGQTRGTKYFVAKPKVRRG